jgi:hypothetical protein
LIREEIKLSDDLSIIDADEGIMGAMIINHYNNAAFLFKNSENLEDEVI